ncbi:GNAT family N-acetyltransferase [bacterium]|nr:GNAT family N-acetyltransferase [bacterium]
MARAHRACLPKTPASRAGHSALLSLYRSLENDPNSLLVWAPETAGFISGTSDLRQTESLIRGSLSLPTFVALAISSLLSPSHLLARRRWETKIPLERTGYILTLGVKDPGSIRGTALLNELENRFNATGIQQIWVDTEATNERAQGFYLKNGYTRMSQDFGHVLLMREF